MAKRISLAFCAVLAALFAVAPIQAEARTLDEIISDGTVRIGVHPNIPPLSYQDASGEWQGFDV